MMQGPTFIFLVAVASAATTAEAQTFQVIATTTGAPAVGAIRAGILYGTTPAGGSGSGSLFRVTEGGTFTPLHGFTGASDGSKPNGRLAIDSAGDLFGTAQAGGGYGGGTLWKFSAGKLTVLHPFGATGDGSDPLQGPTMAGGNLLGTTAGGAIATNGAAFRLSSHGKYLNLHEFASGTDGHCPFSGVAHASPGLIYGTTVGRGFGGNPNGSVWKMTPYGALTTIYKFANSTRDGEWPDQAPAADKAGNLYGTTHVLNGNNFAGAVWKISARGTFSVLHDLVSATDGYAPNSPLVLNRDGNFYGTTYGGGAHGYGTVFRITPAGTFSVMHAFANGTDGKTPTGNLVHDRKGAIYGGTSSGEIFRIIP